jgi:hypothetical protein
MIAIEDVPRAGMFLIVIRFEGYENNYTVRTRKRLMLMFESITEFKLESITFSLIKPDNSSRTTGIMQLCAFSELTPEHYKKFHSFLSKWCANISWWRTWNILIVQDVDLEENKK